MSGLSRTTKGFLWVGAVAFVLAEVLLVRAGDVRDALIPLPAVAVVAILVLLVRVTSRPPERREDPVLGSLERCGGQWTGRITHPLFPGREVELRVKARTEEEFSALRQHVERLAAAPEAVSAPRVAVEEAALLPAVPVEDVRVPPPVLAGGRHQVPGLAEPALEILLVHDGPPLLERMLEVEELGRAKRWVARLGGCRRDRERDVEAWREASAVERQHVEPLARAPHPGESR